MEHKSDENQHLDDLCEGGAKLSDRIDYNQCASDFKTQMSLDHAQNQKLIAKVSPFVIADPNDSDNDE